MRHTPMMVEWIFSKLQPNVGTSEKSQYFAEQFYLYKLINILWFDAHEFHLLSECKLHGGSIVAEWLRCCAAML